MMTGKGVSRSAVITSLQVVLIAVIVVLVFLCIFLINASDHLSVYQINAHRKTPGYRKHHDDVVAKAKPQRHFDWLDTSDAPEPCDDLVPFSLSRADIFNFRSSCDPMLSLDITQVLKESQLSPGDTNFPNSTCPRQLGLTPFRLPTTGLSSWPGSGNSWTRHLLQQLTGVMTGSFYSDSMLDPVEYPGKHRTADVIAIKSHHKSADSLVRDLKFDRKILIMRNPYDAIATDYKRGVLKARHTRKVDIVPNDAWHKRVQELIPRWLEFFQDHLSFQQPQLILVYEDMRACLLRELMRLSNFLKWGKFRHFSICCALQNSVGTAYRNQSRVPVYDLYKGELLRDMNSMLSTLAQNVSLQYPMLAKRLLDYRL